MTIKNDRICTTTLTESPILTDNYLNRHVLQVSMYEYLQNVGLVDDNH